MNHTLNLIELKEFISVLCLKEKIIDKDKSYLIELFSDAKSWDRKLYSLNHILSIVLEQFEKKDIPSLQVINFIYSLRDICDFEVQEGNLQFIDALLSETNEDGVYLEEQLIIAQDKISI